MNINNKNYGFIITRHVNSEKTNFYWNNCVKLLRHYYPDNKIVIIDDKSNKDYVKEFEPYVNIEIIESEFPKRGELLPYYYFIKNNYFDYAVIIHDSTFFHKRINFENIQNDVPVLPLWHFEIGKDPERTNATTLGLARTLKNNYDIYYKLKETDLLDTMLLKKYMLNWYGCYGCQSYISRSFLLELEKKYKITNLLNVVKSRSDRCSLERIMGILFYSEFKNLINIKSLLGSIHRYCKWGYSIENYMTDLNVRKKLPRHIIKVWTGR
jgi:hypothetical protein